MRLLSCLFPAKIGAIMRFYLSGSNGVEMYSGWHYSLKMNKDGSYTAEYKPSGVPDEQALTKQVDYDFAESLSQLMRDMKINRWNGYNKSDKHVMDGTGFTLDVYFTNGRELRAHGYIRTPKGYGGFLGTVEGRFNELFKEEKAHTVNS